MTSIRAIIGAIVEIDAQRPHLLRLATRLLGTRQDAEDAVQEGYLRLLGSDTGSIGSVHAWLATVVTRICLDRLRRRPLEPLLVDPDPAAFEQRSSSTSPASPESLLVADRDARAALAFALRHLSALECVVLLAREIFDIDYRELARRIGRSEAACRQIAHRARERLRQQREARASDRPGDRRDDPADDLADDPADDPADDRQRSSRLEQSLEAIRSADHRRLIAVLLAGQVPATGRRDSGVADAVLPQVEGRIRRVPGAIAGRFSLYLGNVRIATIDLRADRAVDAAADRAESAAA